MLTVPLSRTGVFQQLASFTHGIDFILIILFFLRSQPRQGKVHLCQGAPTLTGMSLVDNDCEMIILVLCANVRKDKWEFLHGGNDNPFPSLNCLSQITGMFCPRHSVAHLHKLLDVIPNLLVQNYSVCNDDNTVHKQLTIIRFQPYELMVQLGD